MPCTYFSASLLKRKTKNINLFSKLATIFLCFCCCFVFVLNHKFKPLFSIVPSRCSACIGIKTELNYCEVVTKFLTKESRSIFHLPAVFLKTQFFFPDVKLDFSVPLQPRQQALVNWKCFEQTLYVVVLFFYQRR